MINLLIWVICLEDLWWYTMYLHKSIRNVSRWMSSDALTMMWSSKEGSTSLLSLFIYYNNDSQIILVFWFREEHVLAREEHEHVFIEAMTSSFQIQSTHYVFIIDWWRLFVLFVVFEIFCRFDVIADMIIFQCYSQMKLCLPTEMKQQ